MNVVELKPDRPKTGAERSKAYRERKALAKTSHHAAPVSAPVVQSVKAPRVTPSRATFNRESLPSALLIVAACGLAVVGVTMNGWFARSLGSSDLAGWLFLGTGVAADAVALAVPSCAARLWHARQRGTAAAGWAIWLMTFVFALTAGLGFASVNISDVTTLRAGRVTPAVENAQAALRDVISSRDRECAGGVGKNCRVREDAVTDRRKALDSALRSVEITADPQTDAAMKIVSWISRGTLTPSADDFAMVRLILLALLPQIGGLLLMIARKKESHQ